MNLAIPKITIEDDDRVYHQDGQIFHKRMRRFCKQTNDKDGYKTIRINCKIHRVHRLIYEKFVGKIKFQIDHINGVKDDNRIENLQDITGSENIRKRGIMNNNTSGFRGVSIVDNKKPFMAVIRINGKNTSKYFLTLNEAISHRIMLELKYDYPCMQ